MWTRALLVIALSAGCHDSPPPSRPSPAPTAASSGSAATATDDGEIAALQARFDQLSNSDDDAAAVVVGKQLVDALRAKAPASHAYAAALVDYGMELRVTGGWKEARAVLEEAHVHPATVEDRALLVEAKFQLGSLYSELRENEKAIATLRAALELASAGSGPDSVHAAVMKEALASAYDYDEQYDLAEPLFREVLATYAMQKDVVRTSRAAANLALNLEYQQRDAEALQLYQRVLVALANVQGYDRTSVAETYSGIGRIHDRQKQYSDSIAAYRKALAIRIEVLGADHPLVGLDYHNLALGLRAAKKLPEAREMCAKALAIRQATLAADHPHRKGTEQLCAELGVK